MTFIFPTTNFTRKATLVLNSGHFFIPHMFLEMLQILNKQKLKYEIFLISYLEKFYAQNKLIAICSSISFNKYSMMSHLYS